MKVNKKNMQTIWFDKNSGYVKIINQTMLPFKLEIKELKNLEDTLIAIKDMWVRGAPLIGVTASYGMYLASKKNSSYDFLLNSGEKLKQTRPTAVNLKWAVDKILNSIKSNNNFNRTQKILKMANEISDSKLVILPKYKHSFLIEAPEEVTENLINFFSNE